MGALDYQACIRQTNPTGAFEVSTGRSLLVGWLQFTSCGMAKTRTITSAVQSRG